MSAEDAAHADLRAKSAQLRKDEETRRGQAQSLGLEPKTGDEEGDDGMEGEGEGASDVKWGGGLEAPGVVSSQGFSMPIIGP